ncbi:MAG: nitroreductase family protein [Nanoarchaeota archaeon]
MDVKEAIESVHQCSSFEKKKVPINVIHDLIKAAAYAPCPGDMECWEFVAVDDKKKLELISNQCPKQSWIKNIPCLLVILRKDDRVKTLYGDRGEIYSGHSCAAAAQCITLRAADLGLATCWIRRFNAKGVARILDVPSEINVELMLALGYPKEKNTPGLSKISVDKITHLNNY